MVVRDELQHRLDRNQVIAGAKLHVDSVSLLTRHLVEQKFCEAPT